MVSCYVIHQGLLNAQTFEPDALMAAIDKLQIANTIYGPITFDNAGANSAKEYLAVQMVNVATTTRKSGVIIKRANDQTGITIEIITPAAAATVDSVFPLPSWSERVYIVCISIFILTPNLFFIF